MHPRLQGPASPVFAAELLVDLDFDGQAVAVKARNVGGIETGHRLGLDDEVLKALVQGVAQMNGAIRIGRAIVKDVGGAALTGFPQLVIEAHRSPASQAKWFILRQIGLHREGSLRQVRVAFNSGAGDIDHSLKGAKCLPFSVTGGDSTFLGNNGSVTGRLLCMGFRSSPRNMTFWSPASPAHPVDSA